MILIKRSRHSLIHTRPFKCKEPACDSEGFSLRKDLERHRKSIHPTAGDTTVFCPDQHCKYSVVGGVGFTRQDNYRRHMTTKHPQIKL